MTSLNPILYAFGAILLWATQALVLSKHLPHVNILVFLTLSFFFSGIFLSMRVKTQIIYFIQAILQSPKCGKVRFKNLLWKRRRRIAAGILGYFFYHLLLFGAIEIGPVITANLLNFLWPLFFMLLSSIFVHENNDNGFGRTIRFIKTLLGLIGCVLLITRGDILNLSKTSLMGDWWGPILGLLAAIVWAVFTLLLKMKEGKPDSKPVRISWVVYPSVAAILSFIALITFDQSIVVDAQQWQRAMLPALYFGFGPLGLAMILYDKAVHLNKADKLARLIFLTPLLSTALLIIFLRNETMNGLMYLGGAFVIIVNMPLRLFWDALKKEFNEGRPVQAPQSSFPDSPNDRGGNDADPNGSGEPNTVLGVKRDPPLRIPAQ